jgi:hypothetical protein
VINFLGVDCQLKHITIDLFESLETSRQLLAKKNLITLLDEYGLRKKILLMLKMKGQT